MYKVDLKTLKEITDFLDNIASGKHIDFDDFESITKTELKAEKLSQKIKAEYTKIKK